MLLSIVCNWYTWRTRQNVRSLSFIVPLLLALALVLYRGHLIPSFHLSPHTYPSSEASKEIGSYATIEGRVAEVSITEKGTVFLDFGANYPDQDFTAVIPAREAGHMIAISAYKGRSMDVTGRLALYRGKPEIVVDSLHQLKIVKSQ